MLISPQNEIIWPDNELKICSLLIRNAWEMGDAYAVLKENLKIKHNLRDLDIDGKLKLKYENENRV